MSMTSTDEWGLVTSDQEEAEESYFVSMTDIMVGLLFIFILMLMAFALMLKNAQQNAGEAQEVMLEAEQALVAAERDTRETRLALLEAERDTQETRQALLEAERDTQSARQALLQAQSDTLTVRRDILDVVRDTRDEVEEIRRLDELRSRMLQDLASRLRERGVQVTVREETGVLQLPDQILFAKADDRLSAEGLKAIGLLAEALDAVLPCYAVLPIGAQSPPCDEEAIRELRLEAVFVEGHTDSDGSAELNWDLSARRAINTFRALEERSDSATSLLNDQGQYLFSVAGYGENRPLVEEVSEEDKTQNRRIDLRFVIHASRDAALQGIQSKLEEALAQ